MLPWHKPTWSVTVWTFIFKEFQQEAAQEKKWTTKQNNREKIATSEFSCLTSQEISANSLSPMTATHRRSIFTLWLFVRACRHIRIYAIILCVIYSDICFNGWNCSHCATVFGTYKMDLVGSDLIWIKKRECHLRHDSGWKKSNFPKCALWEAALFSSGLGSSVPNSFQINHWN